jgi:hypothetical protein
MHVFYMHQTPKEGLDITCGMNNFQVHPVHPPLKQNYPTRMVFFSNRWKQWRSWNKLHVMSKAEIG